MNDQKESSQSVTIGEKEEGDGEGREKGAPSLFRNEGGKMGDDGEDEMWSMWRFVLVWGGEKRRGHCHDIHSHGSSHYFPCCDCGYVVRSARTISMEWSVRTRNEKEKKKCFKVVVARFLSGSSFDLVPIYGIARECCREMQAEL